MAHYVSIMDNWSNVEYVGPFDEQSARQYAAELNARTGFDTSVMDELELRDNFAEYGPVNVSRPQ